MAYRNPTGARTTPVRCLRQGEPHDQIAAILDELVHLCRFETREEALALAELADGERVLELGTYKGFTAVLMAKAGAEHVDTVDWHRGDDLVGTANTLADAHHNIHRWAVADRVNLIVGKVAQVRRTLRHNAYGVVFVDADHDDAIHDADVAYNCIRAHGRILFHDYPQWKVGEAVELLLRKPYTRGELLCDSLYEVYVNYKDVDLSERA